MSQRTRPWPMSSLASTSAKSAVAVFFALSSCACGAPPQDADPSLAPGAPEVELGYTDQGEYVPLEAGSDAPVIWGLQGGTWTMPILRTRGIASPSHVHASLTLASGELLGEYESTEDLLRVSEAWLETDDFRVPVQHAPPNQYESIADVYGQNARIEVQVSDDAGRSAEFSAKIKLVEGS